MKIFLTTILDNVNFGTYLQAYATAKVFADRGADVELMDYVRPYLSPSETAKQYLKNKSLSIPMRMAYCCFYMLLYPIMVWNLKRFVLKRLKVSKRYNSYKEFLKEQRIADIYLTGSDQVWNTIHNKGVDDFFFWRDIHGVKCSYAASIGTNSYSGEHKEIIKKLLTDYKHISVRESFGVEVLKDLGIDAVQVLDPTLLLNKTEWKEIAKNSLFVKKESYLLVYGVEPNRSDFVYEQARRIADAKGLKVYVVCPSIKFKNRCKADKVFDFAKIEDFLALVLDADYMVVCSFHGTSFAINCEKQFITISPSHFNTRVHSLLNLLNIEKCYSTNEVQPEALPVIDYDNVNEILDRERNSSFKFVEQIIQSTTDNKK